VPAINPEVIPSNIKLNVTNMKTIFNGGGKGGAIVPKKGGALARSGGALSTEKIFPLNDFDPLEKRVAANEKKITLLKNVLKAQKPFGGNEDKLAEISSTLEDIGNALALDFSNRISEQDAENKKKKKANEERKRNLKEKSIEGLKGIGKGLGAGIKGVAASVVSPFKNVFDKIINFVTILGAGIAGNAALTWWKNLDPKTKDKIKDTLSFTAKNWKWLAGIGGIFLLSSFVRKIYGVWKAIKFVGSGFGLFKGAKTVSTGTKITTTGGKVVKNLKGPWWKRMFNQGVKSKATSQITGDVLTGTGTKVATKVTTKRILAGSLPIIGAVVDGFEGIKSLVKGDKTSAGLFFASAAASFLPGWGSATSIPLTVAALASQAKFNKNQLTGSKDGLPNLEVDETKVIVEDLPPVKVKPPEKKVSLPESTEVAYISSINPLNEYMMLTPALHGIV